jgi:hypothetical protein
VTTVSEDPNAGGAGGAASLGRAPVGTPAATTRQMETAVTRLPT